MPWSKDVFAIMCASCHKLMTMSGSISFPAPSTWRRRCNEASINFIIFRHSSQVAHCRNYITYNSLVVFELQFSGNTSYVFFQHDYIRFPFKSCIYRHSEKVNLHVTLFSARFKWKQFLQEVFTQPEVEYTEPITDAVTELNPVGNY
jgi:hypothetical protein